MNKLNDELIEQITKGCKTKEELFGKQGVVKQIIKQTLQKALDAELEEHLGYKRHAKLDANKNGTNSRNGYSSKKLQGDFGEIELATPRDRDGSFEPQIVQKSQRRFDGFDDKILALYAKGMTTRDIQATLLELYDVEVSHSLISRVTEAVMDEIKSWQTRPLEPFYAVLYLDCIVTKVKHDKQVLNKAIYLALAINAAGHKELLGLWIAENEGSKFWLAILTELQNRGVKDILITCVDGLKGFPEAINAAFPKTLVQLCIVHMVRNSLRYVASKHMKEVASDLKQIYRSATADEAEIALDNFAAKWDASYPSIAKSWRVNWANIITLFTFPPELRKVIYTTNAIESLNMVIRKAIRNRRIFPNDDSAFKVVYLAIMAASKKWTMPIRDWKPALNRLAIEFPGRVPV
jgi:transposase-like protein